MKTFMLILLEIVIALMVGMATAYTSNRDYEKATFYISWATFLLMFLMLLVITQ